MSHRARPPVLLASPWTSCRFHCRKLTAYLTLRQAGRAPLLPPHSWWPHFPLGPRTTSPCPLQFCILQEVGSVSTRNVADLINEKWCGSLSATLVFFVLYLVVTASIFIWNTSLFTLTTRLCSVAWGYIVKLVNIFISFRLDASSPEAGKLPKLRRGLGRKVLEYILATNTTTYQYFRWLILYLCF
jgi:hypothetical protein